MRITKYVCLRDHSSITSSCFCHFLTSPTHLFDDVILEWSLSKKLWQRILLLKIILNNLALSIIYILRQILKLPLDLHFESLDVALTETIYSTQLYCTSIRLECSVRNPKVPLFHGWMYPSSHSSQVLNVQSNKLWIFAQ